MRRAVLLVLLALPTFGLFPTAHACVAIPPTAEAGGFYVIVRDAATHNVVEVNDASVGLDACDFRGQTIDTYRESNGIPGLQTVNNGCATPDTLVSHVFATSQRQINCRL